GCQFRCLYCHNPDTWNLNNGIPVTLKRATEELRKYRHGLKVMSGGFTLSGGGPLNQGRIGLKHPNGAQKKRVSTGLDTNGSLADRLTDTELEKVNLVLLDIKSWNPDRHRQLTGMEIAPVLDFARRLSTQKRPVWLRFVLVPGLTDDTADIAHLARFA